MTCSWQQLGWPADGRVRVRDLWAKADLGVFVGNVTRQRLKPRDVAMLRLTLLSDEQA